MKLELKISSTYFKMIYLICFMLIFSSLFVGCKKEEVKVEKEVILEEELPYEKIDDISDETFDDLTTRVRDQIMVFDIAEVHDQIYQKLKISVDITASDEEIEVQIKEILDPFMEEWTSNRIRNYLTKDLGEVSENDIERFMNKIDNKSLIEFIVVYEKNFLKGNK